MCKLRQCALALLLGGSLLGPAFSTGTASTEFKAAMAKMQQSMAKPMMGAPDADFAMMMLPHHQGAVDMAKIELKYGHDPQLRKMAEQIVKSQHKEIAELRSWLKKHPMNH